MNFSKKIHKLVGQNENLVKKPQKHDTNLQKNSTLYFQIGLILCLLITFGLFEMNFEARTIVLEPPIYQPVEDVYAFNDRIKTYEEEAPKEEKKIEKPIIFDDPIIVDDATIDKIFKDLTTTPQITDNPQVNISDIDPIQPEEEVGPIRFIAVEKVPIYPGCENLSTNLERRKCMSEKISKLINKKFDKDLASVLGLNGKLRIDTEFKIDKQGNVIEIKARAPHSRLEKEAIRVVIKIPKMIPGKQRDKNVEVIYNLPIIFQVEY